MTRAAVVAALLLLAAAAPGGRTVATLDLARAFGLPAGWRLVATQGPDVEGMVGDTAPGAIALCLRRPDDRCDPALAERLRPPVSPGDAYVDPHYLRRAAVVRPRAGAAPLLLVQAGSLYSVDGGQVVVLQLLAWRAAAGRFERVLRREVGGPNMNEEVRYVDAGPLRGAVIDAVPTRDAPFGYWITVSQPTPALAYRQTARFRSNTRYGDGNPLAVIDAEMPAIEQRLGLWRPGRPLPLPAGACPRPHLRRGALWCR